VTPNLPKPPQFLYFLHWFSYLCTGWT